MIRIFYHSGDWDGIMSGAILRNSIGTDDGLRMHPINYGEDYDAKVFDVVKEHDIVYMADFAMKPIKKMVKLAKQCKELIWIDHHADTIKMSEDIGFNPKGCRVDGTAACILSWMWANGDKPVPEGLKLIGKFDVWQMDDSRIKPFYVGMEQFELNPKLPEVEAILSNDEEFFNKVFHEGNILWNYMRSRYIKTAKSCGFEINFGDYQAFAINEYVDIDVLIEEGIFDPIKYSFLLIFEKRSNWWKFSMRSRGENCTDVSAICRRFGGGGHKQASGFETKDNRLISRMIEGKILIKKEDAKSSDGTGIFEQVAKLNK